MSDQFKQHFPIQANNIAQCTQLDGVKKRKFNTHMKILAPASPIDRVRQHAEVDFFFRPGNQFLGADKSVRRGQQIGRLQLWTSLARDAYVTGVPRDVIDRYRSRYLAGEEKLVIDELANGLGKVALSPIVWGFVFSQRSPVKNAELLDLPCRLGLQDMNPDAYMRLELRIPNGLIPKIPSAFDAGMNELWAPGGTTKPRLKCVKFKGYPEVVVPGKSGSHQNGLTYGNIAPLPMASAKGRNSAR